MQPSFPNSIALHWNNQNQRFESVQRKDLAWSLSDAATLYGALLVERFRTYGGKHLELSDHKARLLLGAREFAIEVPAAIADLDVGVAQLLESNQSVVQEFGDIGIVVLLSPGETSDEAVALGTRPSCMMHLVELPYPKLAKWYMEGVDLCLGSNHVVPSGCWSNQVKSRSRLPYFLADSAVTRNKSGSLAVLTNERGFISDTSVANLLVVDANGALLSPKKEDILVGSTIRVVERLLLKCGIAIQFRDLHPSDLIKAREVLLTGSTGGVWFANTFDGHRIGNGQARNQFLKLAQLWKEHVGLDYIAQAVSKGV